MIYWCKSDEKTRQMFILFETDFYIIQISDLIALMDVVQGRNSFVEMQMIVFDSPWFYLILMRSILSCCKFNIPFLPCWSELEL